jgi:hypothetical protein
MRGRTRDEDDCSDEDDVDALDDDGQDDENDDEPTIACPYCQREIHEDAQRCPYCERYVSDVDSPPTRKPWWLILGVALCIYVVVRWILG